MAISFPYYSLTQTANFILWHQSNQNALLFGDANHSNYHHISFIDTTFDMFFLHHWFFQCFFRKNSSPSVFQPTHWTQVTLMPRRKVLARALCAFTFGSRFRWQVFSHKTHHPEQIFEHVHPETLEIMIHFDGCIVLKWVGEKPTSNASCKKDASSFTDTGDGSEIRPSPVEVGSLSHFIPFFTGFQTSQVVVWDFWTINSRSRVF